MTMDVSEDVSFGASFRKYICFGVVAGSSGVFMFDLRSEFLEEFWIRKSLASVSAVQLGSVLCWQEVF